MKGLQDQQNWLVGMWCIGLCCFQQGLEGLGCKFCLRELYRERQIVWEPRPSSDLGWSFAIAWQPNCGHAGGFPKRLLLGAAGAMMKESALAPVHMESGTEMCANWQLPAMRAREALLIKQHCNLPLGTPFPLKPGAVHMVPLAASLVVHDPVEQCSWPHSGQCSVNGEWPGTICLFWVCLTLLGASAWSGRRLGQASISIAWCGGYQRGCIMSWSGCLSWSGSWSHLAVCPTS